MEVLPSSGSVYSGLNSVEFIFYWRRILWRTTKEIWLSRYSLHDCGAGTLRFQWLRRLYCDLVEVWERYRTAKRQTQIIDDLKSKEKRIRLNPEQFHWMKNVEVVHLYQFVASTKILRSYVASGFWPVFSWLWVSRRMKSGWPFLI